MNGTSKTRDTDLYLLLFGIAITLPDKGVRWLKIQFILTISIPSMSSNTAEVRLPV